MCSRNITKNLFIGYAFKDCLENGTWYRDPVTNSTWTNYTDCVDHEDYKVSGFHCNNKAPRSFESRTYSETEPHTFTFVTTLHNQICTPI